MERLAVCLLFLLPISASAQRTDTDSAEWTGTHEMRVRWLHEAQDARSTRFQRGAERLLLDSAAVAGGRTYRFRIPGREPRRAALRISPAGEVLEAWVEPPDVTVGYVSPTHGFREYVMQSRLTLGGAAMLDDTRLWHVAPFVIPALRPGATATTTLDLRAERFGYFQAIEGPQVVTLERDTIVDGRRLWIGRDSASVRYTERALVQRGSLDTVAVLDRDVEGVLRGRFLYDPELGLFRTRTDTLTGTGTATLHLPDGRSYETAARYEGRSAWALRSPGEQRAHEAGEGRRPRLSMLILPSTPLEERLAAGDTALADSLLREWTNADPDERTRISRMVDTFGPASAEERLDSLRIEAGGWIAKVGAATRDVWAGPPIDSATMAAYIRLLRDPGLAHAHGIDPDPAYENLAGGLVMYPATLGAPEERTSCLPSACRLLAAERDAAEPRLRQIALVASFILEPERWADSLLSRTDTAAALLRSAAWLARGVGATWPSSEKLAIPGETGSWRDWLRWTGGDNDPRRGPDGPPSVRFQESHRFAIRMTERLTGRDIGAELAAAADTAMGDSARFVLRTLALRLGSISPSLEEVVAGLRSNDVAERRLAMTGLGALRESFEPADSALRHEIVENLLDQVLEGDSIWVPGPGTGLPNPLNLARTGPDARALYLQNENVPRPVLDALRTQGIEPITYDQWRGQPPRSGAVLLQILPTMVLGPLVRVGISRTFRAEAEPDQAPSGWATGASYLLLRTDAGWVIVSRSRWVT